MFKYLFILILSLALNANALDAYASYLFQIEELSRSIKLNKSNKDNILLLTSVLNIFLMQAGFAMQNVGQLRAKNVINMLLMCLLSTICTTLIYFSFGQGLSQGQGGGDFSGNSEYGQGNHENFERDWLFHWAQASIAGIIITGSMAERVSLMSFMFMNMAVTGFIFPIVAHWCWEEHGWLKHHGFVDYSGAGVIHMLGGFCGTIGSVFLGPRIGRFESTEAEVDEEFKPHNSGLMSLGAFIMWYGFQGMSTGEAYIYAASVTTLDNVCMSITIAAAGGSLMTMFLGQSVVDKVSLQQVTKGMLSGLIAVSGCCEISSPWVALLIGVSAGLVFYISKDQLVSLEIDDPTDSFSMHGACGTWGMVCSGIVRWGFRGDDFQYLKGCTMGSLIIIGWCCSCGVIIFIPLWYFNVMRVSADNELKGLDEAIHGGYAQRFETDGTYENMDEDK